MNAKFQFIAVEIMMNLCEEYIIGLVFPVKMLSLVMVFTNLCQSQKKIGKKIIHGKSISESKYENWYH